MLAKIEKRLANSRPENDVGRTVGVGAHVDDLDHVAMTHQARGLRLAHEARHHVALVGELGSQQLDGHGLAEDQVGRAIHLAHATGPEQSVEKEKTRC
jgi:hypothetical protein